MPSILTRPSGGGAAPAPSGGYVPPSDWLTLPTVNSGDNKFVGVVAVFDQDNNYITFNATTDGGTWSVDWGDGNTQTGIASGVTAEHKLSYSGATGALTTRGFKTALVTITVDSGNFTGMDLVEPHSEATDQYYQPWLDVRMAANLSSWDSYSTGSEPILGMLERFDWIGSNSLNQGDSMFLSCTALRSVVNLDTSAWLRATQFIRNTPLIEFPVFDTSSMTLGILLPDTQLDEITITDTDQITSGSISFQGSILKHITIQNTGVGNRTSLQACFSTTPNLIGTPDLGDTSGVTNWLAFCINSGIRTMAAHDLSGATNMTSWVSGCHNLSRILAFGATITHSIANCNLDVDAIEEYATNLGDGTGQTLTTSNNPASGSWNTTIATAKNWTVVD